MATIQPIRLTIAALLVVLLMSSLLSPVDCGKPRRGRSRRTKRGDDKCSSDSVAEYKLTFHGTWSRDKFPRMYPRHRPSAQWSKVVGRTHDLNYQMWSEGTMATAALKRFAEEGDTLLYDMEPQGYNGVFDTFNCEAIRSGEGRTSTFILVDGTHSKLSFVTKMVPSPDWFVGLDGLDICRHGRWRARAHVNLRPMDAGTDRGYTFTSPNWPSYPQESIYQITSTRPDHPASAFLYPEYKRLPRLAYVDVERVAIYARKGPVSDLKSNAGSHLVVIEETTTTTTTTTTTPTTVTANDDEVAVADVAGKSEVSENEAKDDEDVDNDNSKDSGHAGTDDDDDDVIEKSKAQEAPKQLQKTLITTPQTSNTTTTTTVITTIAAAQDDDKSRDGHVPSTADTPTDVDDNETSALTVADDDLMSLQSDVAQMQELAEDSRPILERMQEKKAHSFNVSPRKPAATFVNGDSTTEEQRVHPGPVLETDKIPDTVSISTTGKRDALVETTVQHNLNLNTLTSQKSSESEATPVQINQHPSHLTTETHTMSSAKALTSNLHEQDAGLASSTSADSGDASNSDLDTGSVSSKNDPPSVERPPVPDRKIESAVSSPPLTKSSASPNSTVETARSFTDRTFRLLSSGAEQASPKPAAAHKTPPFVDEATDDGKHSLHAERKDSSQQQPQKAPAGPVANTLTRPSSLVSVSSPAKKESEVISQESKTKDEPKGEVEKEVDPEASKPQMRSGDVYGKHKGKFKSLGTTEPSKAQSKHTFDQPQFEQVSHERHSKKETAIDCRVTEWTEWGPCSKTCGYGVRQRSRDVTSHSKNGGYSCPLLEQEALCGSMRTCNWNHFSFLSHDKPQQPMRKRRHHHSHSNGDLRRRYA